MKRFQNIPSKIDMRTKSGNGSGKKPEPESTEDDAKHS